MRIEQPEVLHRLPFPFSAAIEETQLVTKMAHVVGPFALLPRRRPTVIPQQK